MKLLHVTHNKNINSIIRHGLLPSYIELDSHWEGFQDYLTNRFCVYLWDAETYKNDKFVRDMIYTKMFIHPRNRFFNQREHEIERLGLNIEDDSLYPDFRKIGSKLIGDSSVFSVLEVDIDQTRVEGMWQHVQEPHDDKHGTTVVMDDYYAHDDKQIYISGNTISFDNIKIVEEVLVRKYKNHKLGFTFRKN